jgi:hypothetical protein
MRTPKQLTIELTKDEADALVQAIDDHFFFHGMSDSIASDIIEQMHSKVSNALIAGGFYRIDCEDPSSLN